MAEFNVDYLPIDMQFVDEKGMLTPEASQYMRSVHNLVSNNFNANGTHLPTIDPESLVKTPTGALENGAAYYNTTANQTEVIENGVRKKFTTTPV